MASEPPPQNIYDDPAFFAGYATLERFGDGWTTAVELPVLLGLLPDPAGLRVLDLGCGMGQLARHIAEAGADRVVAVDLSARMLESARTERSHARVSYVRAALEDVAFAAGQFDLVVSSLAFHYAPDYAALMRRIASWLVPGGVLACSMEHPIYTSGRPLAGGASGDVGRSDPVAQRTWWAVQDYPEEGLREQRWFVEGVRKYHRTFETLVNAPLDAGLVVERVHEPVPDAEVIRRRPAWQIERQRPTFLLLRARKPES